MKLRTGGAVVLVVCSVVLNPAGRAQERAIGTPGAGHSEERTITAGQVHKYAVHLDRGQFLYATVTPTGIDVAVALQGPTGQLLVNVDLSPDQVAAEELFVVSTTPGTHRIVVTAPSAARGSGRYVIRVSPPRPDDADTSVTVKARRTLEEAVRLAHDVEPVSWRSAVPLFDEALAGFERVNDRRQLARTLYEAAWNDGRPDTAALAGRALAIYRELGDPLGIARTMGVVGRLEVRRGELANAARTLTEALALHERSLNRAEESATLNHLGIVYGRSGEPERAITAFQSALRIGEELKLGLVRSMALTNLGIATKDLGDFRRSLTYYDSALALARERRDRNAQLHALVNLANLHRILGDLPRALSAYRVALPLAQTLGDRDSEARALNGLGATHYRQGEFQQALDVHDASLRIRQALKDPSAEAASLDAGALALHRLGRTDEAIGRLTEALTIRQRTAERLGESDTLLHLAQVERDRGELPRALGHVEAAVALTDTLRGQVLSPESRASFIAAEQDRYELHVDVLMQLHRNQPGRGFDIRAFEATERGRARVLLESLAEARIDIRQGADVTLLDRERADQRAADSASRSLSRLLTRDGPVSDVEAARVNLATASSRLQATELEIRRTSPQYAALTQPTTLTADAIRRDVIDGETLLLEYSLGETRSWLWVVAPDGLLSFELPPRRVVEASARRVYAGLTARQPRAGESAASRATRVKQADATLRDDSLVLSRMVLGQAAAHFGPTWRGRRLLIVAADVLLFLPFTALPDPGVAGQPLLTHHEIVHLPSASALSLIRQQTDGRVPAPRQLAIIADPVFNLDDPRIVAARGATTGRAGRSLEAASDDRIPHLARLPFTRDEARAIAAFAPADQRFQATDFRASRATILGGELAAFRFVHLATHGVFNSEQPEFSGLVLSMVDRTGQPQDGFLRLTDIYNLRLPAEVVVLSACQTALGQSIRGEGIVGLTRGFMYAGARRVVASLWQVDDLATAELMRLFYRGMLTEGLTPAAALRRAQRELAKQPRWASPFYWSAFVLQGEWR